MKTLNARVRTMSALALAAMLVACASSPPAAPARAPARSTAAGAEPPASAEPATTEKAAPPGQTRYKWTKATEAEVAAQLDKKFQDAAKYYVQLKRNDQLMFCKRYREIGSTIRTLHCITEAELRKQVEDSDQVRDQIRNRVGKCTLGQNVPCSGN